MDTTDPTHDSSSLSRKTNSDISQARTLKTGQLRKVGSAKNVFFLK